MGLSADASNADFIAETRSEIDVMGIIKRGRRDSIGERPGLQVPVMGEKIPR